MTFLWCILALSLALGIARYNQSNKLFWVLFISFLTGIASAAIYDKVVNCNNDYQSKTMVKAICPTQDMQGNILAQAMLLPATADNSKGNAPASKDYILPINTKTLVLKDWVKDIPLPPPQTLKNKKLCYIHILIPHDGIS